MKKLFLTGFFLAFVILQVSAQNETDALRFSMLSPVGTARFISTGGAFSALGGDFSTLSTNPAGIAIYRSNEITITPSLNFTKVQSSFLGNTEEDIMYNFGLSNIGFVFAFNEANVLKESGWLGFQFGFGLTNQLDFNSRMIYEGFNTQNSLMKAFLERATAETNFNSSKPESYLDAFTTGLAWDTYLLGFDRGANEYFIDMEKDVLQRRSTKTSGSVRELNVSFGANYSNRLYLGASFGFPFARYEETFVFTEENSKGFVSEFNSLEFGQTLKTNGTGFNFKLGAIYRVTDMIRLGAALHTPTFYNLEDEFQTNMKSDLESFGRDSKKSEKLIFDYEINSPLKLTTGIGLIFGTTGLISIDYEYSDFSQMRLRSKNDLFTLENRRIRKEFQKQHTLRMGGELRLNPLVLRAGYALASNPIDAAINDLSKTTISAGIGIREKGYFVDLGYFVNQYSEKFYQYYSLTGSRSSSVNYDVSKQGFVMTVGFRF